MKEVSTYLGNTPAVARASYVDPRLIDLFNDGITIDPALAVGKHDLAGGTTHGRIERAVHELLTHTKRELRRGLAHLLIPARAGPAGPLRNLSDPARRCSTAAARPASRGRARRRCSRR